ncbi:MAG: tRNA pseudouridine(13) synthase TruD [Candidatus Sericytochromatia bacterium]|nr:tRNA pseudouridine(13) synthase TruD [Candidatus Sericytochromatia bacterium]
MMPLPNHLVRDHWLYDPARWPFLTSDVPGTGGRIRQEVDDFRVDERQAAPFDGEGDHVVVRIEKRDRTTRDVMDALQEAFGLDVHAVGHAGLKDRRAVTTQWLSLPASTGISIDHWPEIPGVRLLEVDRHGKKLQAGHSGGNHFQIHVRGADGQADQARAVLSRLQRTGVPNYFGPQRFGRDGDNAWEGLQLLARGRKPRGWRETLLCQAVQSWVFNDWLAHRLAIGSFAEVFRGDIAIKHVSGGKFQVGDAEVENRRAADFEISATGPLFGRKFHEAADRARAEEDQVLATLGLERAGFRPLPGSRRAIRIPLGDAEVSPTETGFWLRFSLPPGGYATAVLREVLKDHSDVDGEGMAATPEDRLEGSDDDA